MFQSRVVVLALLVIVAASAIASYVIFGHRVSLHTAIALAATMALAFVVSFFYLRHAGLALMVALGPLPGAIAAASFGANKEPLTLAYLAGFVIALFLADGMARSVVDGAGAADAVAKALRENALACAAAAMAATAFLASLLFAGTLSRAPLVATLAELASCFSALVVLPLAVSQLPFSEDFVTRANRLRELRERRLEKFAAITEPRWGWSLTGIGVVFFALAFFGSRTLHVAAYVAHAAPEIWLVAVIVAIGAALAATRDWRRALSAPIALGLAALIGCWGYVRAGVPLNGASWLALMQVLGIGAAMILLVASAARPTTDEDATAASVRSLLGKTGVVVASSFCAIVVALALSLVMGREAIALAAALFFAGVGAVLLQPAITIAIETLAPRRSVIEARYRVS